MVPSHGKRTVTPRIISNGSIVEFSSGSILKFPRQSIGSFEGIQPWSLQGVGREASKGSVGGEGGKRFAVLAAGYVGTRRGKVRETLIWMPPGGQVILAW
jgi:hypothetical protein